MIIRRATAEDAAEVTQLGRSFAAASPYSGMAPVSEKAVTRFLETVDCAAFFVAEDESGLLGGCAVIAFPLWWSDSTLLAQELFWWVDPIARGTGAAKGMMQAMEQWATEYGCKHMFMVCLENEDSDRVGKLYQRAGYKPIERSFLGGL